MTKTSMPSQEDLKKLLKYSPYTGKLFWRKRGDAEIAHFGLSEKGVSIFNGRNAQKEAFTARNEKGYMRGLIFGKQYRAHRVIYKLYYGTEPEEIDHINGIRDDNRISNLRSSSRHKNQRNLPCHRRGQEPCLKLSSSGKWEVRVTRRGKQKYVGSFKSKDEAIKARDAIS